MRPNGLYGLAMAGALLMAVDTANAQTATHEPSVSPQADEPMAAPAAAQTIVAIRKLVEEACGVQPSSIFEEDDAYRVALVLEPGDRSCLDEVVHGYDKESSRGRSLAFDVATTSGAPNMPVLHISSIGTGPFAHVRLQDGRTLFPGAIVNGWRVESIDGDGVVMVRERERFIVTFEEEASP